MGSNASFPSSQRPNPPLPKFHGLAGIVDSRGLCNGSFGGRAFEVRRHACDSQLLLVCGSCFHDRSTKNLCECSSMPAVSHEAHDCISLSEKLQSTPFVL